MKKVELLEKENARLQSQIDGLLEYHGKPPKDFAIMRQQGDTRQATEVILASDWHIDEKVDPDTVNDLNTFDEEVCDKRVQDFFAGIVGYHEMTSQRYQIREMVLALLGDFISSSLHEELMENNTMLPIEAIMKAQDYLYNGIRFLLKETDCNITIPCCYGNHARLQKEKKSSTAAGNNLETFMYANLAKLLKDEPRVQFLITKSYHNYLKVYDHTLRLHHGDNVRYYGAVSGIYLSMNKALTQWNKGRRATLSANGHFHQLRDGGDFISNGSLIGYNAYAMSIKADYEKPKQAYFLIEPELGKTVVAPIELS